MAMVELEPSMILPFSSCAETLDPIMHRIATSTEIFFIVLVLFLAYSLSFSACTPYSFEDFRGLPDILGVLGANYKRLSNLHPHQKQVKFFLAFAC
jgi:hypothetical protein